MRIFKTPIIVYDINQCLCIPQNLVLEEEDIVKKVNLIFISLPTFKH